MRSCSSLSPGIQLLLVCLWSRLRLTQVLTFCPPVTTLVWLVGLQLPTSALVRVRSNSTCSRLACLPPCPRVNPRFLAFSSSWDPLVVADSISVLHLTQNAMLSPFPLNFSRFSPRHPLSSARYNHLSSLGPGSLPATTSHRPLPTCPCSPAGELDTPSPPLSSASSSTSSSSGPQSSPLQRSTPSSPILKKISVIPSTSLQQTPPLKTPSLSFVPEARNLSILPNLATLASTDSRTSVQQPTNPIISDRRTQPPTLRHFGRSFRPRSRRISSRSFSRP
jgi:hypothetical protein